MRSEEMWARNRSEHLWILRAASCYTLRNETFINEAHKLSRVYTRISWSSLEFAVENDAEPLYKIPERWLNILQLTVDVSRSHTRAATNQDSFPPNMFLDRFIENFATCVTSPNSTHVKLS